MISTHTTRTEARAVVEFDQIHEFEQAEHPTIKGLPRGRQSMGATLLGGEQGFPWLRVRDHVDRLARLISLNFGLVRLLAGWVPNCASYDLKTELPRLMYEDMRHLVRLNDRFNQLPGSGRGIEASDELKDFLNRLGAADDHHCFLAGFYFEVKRALLIALEDYQHACDPLYDAPTIYELRGIIPEVRDQIEWANTALLESRLDLVTGRRVREWRSYVRALLAEIGGVLGDDPRPAAPPPKSPACAPLQPAPENFIGDPQMHYMDHFPFDQEEAPVHLTLREIVYHNATEWAAVDHLCVLFFGARNMPLEFYLDVARHTWDECRHSRMGMRRLREMGFDPFRDFKWPYHPKRTQDFAEWFGSLTMLAEACSFTRKHGSVEPFYRFGDALSAQQSEIDCLDERLHVTFGRQWYPVMARQAGDNRPLRELVTSLREKSILARQFRNEELTDEEKLAIAQSATAFCNAIEFDLDFTVY
jgi:hypothetical protein